MKILIVEDDPKIAKALKKGLEQEAFSIDIAYTGTLGYDLGSSEIYDLVLLDIMLPEMNGLEVCKKLRKDGINTPILMLTAKNEMEEKINGLNIGADDYLTKPFAFEELLARVKALLRRPANTLKTILTCGSLSVDTNSYQVRRLNNNISLSKREYALLEYLIRNQGKILTKEQIISHVWEYDADVLPNTVEQYIGYLRNKIDKKFGDQKSLIHTVRGFGYKMEELNV